MTPAEIKALTVGSSVTDGAGTTGTVSFTRDMSSPQEIDGIIQIDWAVNRRSIFNYDDPALRRWSVAGPAYGPAEDPMTGVPAPIGGSGSYSLGVRYQFLVAGRITALRFMRSATSGYTTRALTLYSNTGTVLKTVTTSAEVTGWNQVMLATPQLVAVNERVVVGYPEPANHMARSPVYTSVPAHITTVEGTYGTLGTFPNTPIANMHMASFLFEPQL